MELDWPQPGIVLADTVTRLDARQRSLWATGRLSCVNREIWRIGVVASMTVQEAVARLSN